jgi:hypothetical protein
MDANRREFQRGNFLQDAGVFLRFCGDDVQGINQVWQLVLSNHYYHSPAEGDEIGVRHVKPAAICQVKDERTKTISRQFAQLLDLHARRFNLRLEQVKHLSVLRQGQCLAMAKPLMGKN